MLKQLKYDSLNDYSDIEQVLATTSSNTMSHSNHHNSNNQYVDDSNNQNNECEWRMQPILMD